MDELKTIEAFTKELEALRNYDRIKKERDELVEKCSKLETRVSELEGELASLKESKIGFVGKELTLGQAKVEFVRAYNDEIERKANEKFEVLKVDLENKMPKLVFNKLIEIVGKPPPWPKEIAGAIESKAGKMASEILINKERWPAWFKEFYLKEVRAGISAGLNAEFARAVEGEAAKRAEVKLRQLTRVEWPKWYGVNVKPKIEENVIVMMRAPWDIWCDKCGVQQKIEFTEQDISDLLTIGYVEKECTNPNCKDLKIWKHRIRIFLRDLIAAHIGG